MFLKLPIMLLSTAQNQAYYAQNYAWQFKLCFTVIRNLIGVCYKKLGFLLSFVTVHQICLH